MPHKLKLQGVNGDWMLTAVTPKERAQYILLCIMILIVVIALIVAVLLENISPLPVF